MSTPTTETTSSPRLHGVLLAPGRAGCRLAVAPGPERTRVVVHTTLEAVASAVVLQELQLLVRAADGRLLDYSACHLDEPVCRQRLVRGTFWLSPNVVDAAHTLEVRTRAHRSYETRLVHASLCDDPLRGDGAPRMLRLDLQEQGWHPGRPDPEIALSATVRRHPEPRVDLMVALSVPNAGGETQTTMFGALIDREGNAQKISRATLPWEGAETPAVRRLRFHPSVDELRRCVGIDIVVKGQYSATERLGVFDWVAPSDGVGRPC